VLHPTDPVDPSMVTVRGAVAAFSKITAISADFPLHSTP
jgi:hypothetical protein